jgi:hypothetical protein
MSLSHMQTVPGSEDALPRSTAPQLLDASKCTQDTGVTESRDQQACAFPDDIMDFFGF